VKRPLSSSPQMEAARGVEERRELGQPVAVARGSDLRQLLPDVLRCGQSETPSSARSRRLTATPADP
jgi:hypothetical protein